MLIIFGVVSAIESPKAIAIDAMNEAMCERAGCLGEREGGLFPLPCSRLAGFRLAWCVNGPIVQDTRKVWLVDATFD